MTQRFLTMAEAAATLRIESKTAPQIVARLCTQHGIATIKAGRRRLISESALQELIEALTCSPSGAKGASGMSVELSAPAGRSRTSGLILQEKLTSMKRARTRSASRQRSKNNSVAATQ